jgi:8-oxo-dGTP pyrophosphatase MutT (NUDIX family)
LVLDAFLEKLTTQLRLALPGEAVQYTMAPVNRTPADAKTAEEQYRESAVLVLICSDGQGRLFLPLIERMAYEGVHSAQISLPGGQRDVADHSLLDTALRECREEIGSNTGIQVAGRLSRLFIPVSRFMVEPFVAVSHDRDPYFTPHAREVRQIIRLYLDTLLNETAVKRGMVTTHNRQVEAPYFEVAGYQVWGATAMILAELKAVLKVIF